jgi:anaerobic selenocysteine-containing dehydrogenase
MAETQPVLWMRVLDRPAGGDPPRLVCVDPRPTPAAQHATVHLAPRAGTNVLLNALLHEIIRTDRIDHDFIDAHTVGFDELSQRVADRTPAWAARICDVLAARIAEAAEILGGVERLLSTALQGVYQSHPRRQLPPADPAIDALDRHQLKTLFPQLLTSAHGSS